MKTVSLCFVILLTARLLAAGTVPLSDPARTGPAAFQQTAPAVAGDGSGFLAAWTTIAPTGSYSYLTRIGLDGSLTGMPSPLDTEDESWGVSVTRGRDGYLAAWVSPGGVNAAVVESSGVMRNRVSVPRAGADARVRTLSAWSGSSYLVVSGFERLILGTLIDNGGNVVKANIPLGDSHGHPEYAALTADGNGFLLLVTKETYVRHDIYARRFSVDGIAGDWFLVRSAASAISGVSVSWNGSRDVLAWSDELGVWATELDPATNQSGDPVQIALGPATIGRAVSAAGRTFVAWVTFDSSVSRAWTASIEPDGSVSGSQLIGEGYGADLAASGQEALAVMLRLRAYVDSDVLGRFLSEVGPSGSEILISRSALDQEHADLATDGTTLLAVWDEETGGRGRIFAGRIDSSRQPLDGQGIEISSEGDNRSPAASFNGVDYLVVWNQEVDGTKRIVGARLSHEGHLLDVNPIDLGSATNVEPKVASDGNGWLVVWANGVLGNGCSNYGCTYRIVAARVSAAGGVLDPGGVVVGRQAMFDQLLPDVAWTGSSYVAVWRNFCAPFHNPVTSSIGAAFLSRDLSQIDIFNASGTGRTLYPPSSTLGLTFGKPRVAGSSGLALIAWERWWNGSTSTEFRLLPTPPVQASPARPRAAGRLPFSNSVNGSLIAVGTNADGGFTILNEGRDSGDPPKTGVFETKVDLNGTYWGGFILQGLNPRASFLGRLVAFGGAQWVVEREFHINLGANRLSARNLD